MVYTIQRAAEFLGKSERTIRYYIEKGHLTVIDHVGRQPILDLAQLDELKRNPPPGPGWPRGKKRPKKHDTD